MQNQKTFPSCTKDLQTNTILISSETDTCTLIFLPGFDQTSQTHKQLFILPQSPSFNNVRTIILQPPLRPITFLNKQQKNNWFDIKNKHQNLGKLSQNQIFDLQDINSQTERLQHVVDKQILYWKQKTGEVNYSKIFICGFAHGGIVSLAYGLRCPELVGGIGCFGGYLLQEIECHERNRDNVDILLVHGENDTLFETSKSKLSYEKLIGKGNVQWRLMEGIQHRFTREEIGLLNGWIQGVRRNQIKK